MANKTINTINGGTFSAPVVCGEQTNNNYNQRYIATNNSTIVLGNQTNNTHKNELKIDDFLKKPDVDIVKLFEEIHSLRECLINSQCDFDDLYEIVKENKSIELVKNQQTLSRIKNFVNDVTVNFSSGCLLQLLNSLVF